MKNPIVTITMADGKQIKIELYPDVAPETVNNFVSLVNKGFYNGLKFHRVINDFMIQGGDPRGNGTGGESIWGGSFSDEFDPELHNLRGALSMARTSDPDSASSQFFIMHKDAPHLDAQYAAFGLVTDGIDVVDKIADVRTGRMGYFADVPRTPVVIESIKRV